jgi:Domain of unknown function (DUF4407)
MLQRLFWNIAGIDRETLATCPMTDRLWATHLGFALCLSFIVIFGISFHATSYVLDNVMMRLLTALVVALTVFMFDRALYQSDWFYQGIFRQPGSAADKHEPVELGQSARRFLRITIRLAISFGLAWVIALFLELAIFSDTISERLKSYYLTANQPSFQKIQKYEAELDTEIARRRSNLAALEVVYRSERAATVATEPSPTAQWEKEGEQLIRAAEEQIATLDAQERELRTELRQIEEKITGYSVNMNAEQMGRRVNPSNSGRAGAGPLYEFAKRQREIYEAQRQAREQELAQLDARRAELRAHQRRITSETSARREQERSAARNYRDELQSQLDAARSELRGLESARLAKIEEFRRKEIGGSEFQKQKDDPLARMRAYQELKNDPRDGATIVWFSWMTKLLVIFLEVVPVVAKMFFSPPSAYAARIQAQVEREMVRARQEGGAVLARDVPFLNAIDALWTSGRGPAPAAPAVRTVRPRSAPEGAVS